MWCIQIQVQQTQQMHKHDIDILMVSNGYEDYRTRGFQRRRSLDHDNT